MERLEVMRENGAAAGDGAREEAPALAGTGKMAALGKVYVAFMATTGPDGISLRGRGCATDELLAVTVLDARAPLGTEGAPAPLFSSLFRPGRRRTWPSAEKAHRITPAMVAAAPACAGEVLRGLEEVLNAADALVVADGRALGLLATRARLRPGLAVADCRRDLEACPAELRDRLAGQGVHGAGGPGPAADGAPFDGGRACLALLGTFLALLAGQAARLRPLAAVAGDEPCRAARSQGGAAATADGESGRGDAGGLPSPDGDGERAIPAEERGGAPAPERKPAGTLPEDGCLACWMALSARVACRRRLVEELEEGVDIWLAAGAGVPGGLGRASLRVFFGLCDRRKGAVPCDAPWCAADVDPTQPFGQGKERLLAALDRMPGVTPELRGRLAALIRDES